MCLNLEWKPCTYRHSRRERPMHQDRFDSGRRTYTVDEFHSDMSCLINCSVKSNSPFWYYIKQIMHVSIRAMVRIFSFNERWNVLFNEAIAEITFQLSLHENILTIARINGSLLV